MFKTARIKLTAWYLLIIMFISLLFSSIIYQVLTLEFSRFTHAQQMRMGTRVSGELVLEAKKRVALSLLTINGVIFVVAGVLGYILAGKTLSPIEEMSKKQRQFIGDASHELKTPITALKTTLEVYARESSPSSSETKEAIHDSLKEVDRMEHLVASLLTLSRFDEAHSNKEKTQVKKLLREAVGIMTPIAKKRQVAIRLSGSDHTVSVNKNDIVQLFTILIDNAVKYSPQGKHIELHTDKKYPTVTVRDYGPGIPKKDLPYIYDRFYRADSSRATGGYGLGLSIAKSIAQENGIALKMLTTSSQGTTFQVKFRS